MVTRRWNGYNHMLVVDIADTEDSYYTISADSLILESINSIILCIVEKKIVIRDCYVVKLNYNDGRANFSKQFTAYVETGSPFHENDRDVFATRALFYMLKELTDKKGEQFKKLCEMEEEIIDSIKCDGKEMNRDEWFARYGITGVEIKNEKYGNRVIDVTNKSLTSKLFREVWDLGITIKEDRKIFSCLLIDNKYYSFFISVDGRSAHNFCAITFIILADVFKTDIKGVYNAIAKDKKFKEMINFDLKSSYIDC